MTIFVKCATSDRSTAARLLVNGKLNPDLPPEIYDWVHSLWQEQRRRAAGDEEAWRLVVQMLGTPEEPVAGPDGCSVFLREGFPQSAGLPTARAFVGDPDPEWWESYGVSLPRDQEIPMPNWDVAKLLVKGLDEVAALFLRKHVAAYKGDNGVEYVQAMLDLGDRPLSIVLSREGVVALESPLENDLPRNQRAYSFVLEELAYKYDAISFRVDGQSILVARRRELVGIRVFPELLGSFLADISFAVTDLRKQLERWRKQAARLRLPADLEGRPCVFVTVYEDVEDEEPVVKERFQGPLYDEEERMFNFDIPKPALRYILAAWEYYRDRFNGDVEAFAYHYLRRMPRSTALAYSGCSAFVFWDEDCQKDLFAG